MPDTPAREVARRLEIPVIELAWSPEDAAGLFTLDGSTDSNRDDSLESPLPDDVALVLHTSGTTSRPKIVPLTHANLSASALRFSVHDLADIDGHVAAVAVAGSGSSLVGLRETRN